MTGYVGFLKLPLLGLGDAEAEAPVAHHRPRTRASLRAPLEHGRVACRRCRTGVTVNRGRVCTRCLDREGS